MKGLILALVGLATIASVADAQTGRHVALGVGLGFHKYVDGDFKQKSPSLSIIYRLAFKTGVKDGWTLEPKGTIDWFKTDVRADVGTADVHIGKLRSIPVLVGAGPSYRHGRVKVGVAIVAGPSFNHFTADNTTTSIKVKNSVVVRPDTGIWYDVSSRLGLHANVGYVYNRPTADTSTGGSTTSEKWKTDHVNFSVGFAIGVF
jgi:opacity protein-like surface antigen